MSFFSGYTRGPGWLVTYFLLVMLTSVLCQSGLYVFSKNTKFDTARRSIATQTEEPVTSADKSTPSHNDNTPVQNAVPPGPSPGPGDLYQAVILQIMQFILLVLLGKTAANCIYTYWNGHHFPAILFVVMAEFCVLVSHAAVHTGYEQAREVAEMPQVADAIDLSSWLSIPGYLWPWFSICFAKR